MIDIASLPPAWQTLYSALETMFGIGLGMTLFAALICLLAPFGWVFMGKRNKEEF